jgi:hypothetical protein
MANGCLINGEIMGRLILPNVEASQQQPQETGLLGQAGQGALDLVATLAGIPGSLLESGRNSQFAQSIKQQRNGNVFEPSAPTSQNLVSGARKLTGYAEPQTTAQRFAYNAGQAIPQTAAALLTGGASAAVPAAAAGVGSAAGKTASQELGLGTIGDIALSVIGGGLGSNLARGGTKAIANRIPVIRRESYKTAEEAGKKLPLVGGDVSQVQKDILNIEANAKNAIGGPLSKKYYKQLLHDTNTLTDKIKKGNANVWDLVEAKKKLNTIAYDYKVPDKVRYAFGDARDSLNNTIRNFEEVYKEFGMPYRKGENLTTFIKGSERFKDFFKQHKELDGLLSDLPNEVTHIIKQIGSPSTLSKTLYKAAVAPLRVPVKYAANEYKNARELLSNPETGKLIQELYKGIAEDNVGNVARSLLSLTGNGEENTNQPQQSQQKTEKARGRLILPS